MRGLISAAVANPVFSNLLMVGLLLAGLSSVFSLTVKNFPEINLGAVQVTVAFPGATPREVADAIVVPIEGKVRSIDGIKRITAEARSGVATVTASLGRGVNVTTVLDDMRSAVNEITVFPTDAESPIVSEVVAPELAIQLILAGDVPVGDLKNLAISAREDLLALPNISAVEISGVAADQIDILVPRETLNAYDFGLRDLAARLANESVDLSGGTLLSDQQRLELRTAGEAETGAAYEELPVLTSADGAVVVLSDIATVVDGFAETGVISRLDGHPAVFLTVNREGDQQIINLVETTRNYMEHNLIPRLPDTVEVIEWRNEAELLTGRIDLLSGNAMIGVVLILILLAVTLEARIAIWVVVGIATSFLISFTMLLVFGVTINQLSLFGFILALGVVVDDAIVVGENIYEKRLYLHDPKEAAEKGVLGIAAPVFFAVTTTMCAFVPLLLLPGTSGAFVAPIAAVVLLVLLFSLIDSIFILPRHLAGLSNKEGSRWSPITWLARSRKVIGGTLDRIGDTGVRRLACFVVARPFFTILLCFGLLIGSLSVLTGGVVKFVFFPEIEGDYVVATIEMPEGTSETATLRRADAVAAAAQDAAQTIADRSGQSIQDTLIGTSVAIGFAVAAGDPNGVGAGSTDTATVEVKIQEAGSRTFGAAEFEELWREAANDISGIVELTFSSSVVPVGADATLRIGSESDAARQAAVDAIRSALMDRSGVISISDSDSSASQEAVFVLNRNAKSLGITTSDIARELRSAVFGELVTTLQRDEEEVDVRVRLPLDQRTNLNDLEDYRVRLGGRLVPVSTLGSFSVTNAPTTIQRVDTRRITTLEADVDEAVTTGSAEIAFVQSQVVPPLQDRFSDLTVTLGGEAEEQDEFGPSLAVNFGLALFAIFALLSLALKSYLQPILILLVIPFGFLGALLGHVILNLDLTLLSIFGVIGLSGIVINGALLLMNATNERRDAGQDRDDAIVEAVVSRFRPIFLTTLTTFLGVTPLVLETSIQAQFLIPTAVSLGGGIIIGAFFVLFLTPAYLSASGNIADLLQRRVALLAT